MPRYFFDVHDRAGFHRDRFGDELATIEEAREQCQAILPDIVQEELPDGDLHTVTCDVRDEAGRVVYRGEITYRGGAGSEWSDELTIFDGKSLRRPASRYKD